MSNHNVCDADYPRPQLRRAGWISLDGLWDFALDREAEWATPAMVVWSGQIRVPFAPETRASGVADTGLYRACWYRRTFEALRDPMGQRTILHFGAVDYSATVWVNGAIAARHEGGYTPFSADITDFLNGDGPHTLVVRAEDDPADLAKPRGKQDWQLEPHSIWYPRTTGIWQTVWLEQRARDPSRASCAGRRAWSAGKSAWRRVSRDCGADDLQLEVRLTVGDQLLADDSYQVIAGEVHRRIALSDPGIDDFRNELLWSPATPTLIDAALAAMRRARRTCWTRSPATPPCARSPSRATVHPQRPPLFLRLVLDQGYWPEAGLTRARRRGAAPRRGAGQGDGLQRRAQAPEDRGPALSSTGPTVLGLLVWEEMPSAYRYTTRSIERLTREWTEVIERDRSHPCIVAWVPFNESWGVPDLPDSPAQRHYVQALYHLTKTLDPTRPVIGNDGWESVATDIIGIHDYDDQPERIGRRYGSDDNLSQLFKRERPGGRLLTLAESDPEKQPIVLTEFGGIAYAPAAAAATTWGYSQVLDEAALAKRYASLLRVIHDLPSLAGFCYTQFADTYQEANGLLYADRTPKMPLEEIARADLGQTRPTGCGRRASLARPSHGTPTPPIPHTTGGPPHPRWPLIRGDLAMW